MPQRKYWDLSDREFQTMYLLDAMERQEFLAHDDLDVEELCRESQQQIIKTFLWFGGLCPNDKEKIWPKLCAGLVKLQALQDSNRERAQRMLARLGAVEEAV